jgi:hypothetical protein
MKAATAKKARPKPDAMERYIGEIDRFAGMLRTQQEKIRDSECRQNSALRRRS